MARDLNANPEHDISDGAPPNSSARGGGDTLTGSAAASTSSRYRIIVSISAYLIVGLMAGRYAQSMLAGGDRWSTGDWLINYEAGFVRRGLVGQVLYAISDAGVSLLWTAWTVQVAVYLALAHLVLKLYFSAYRGASWLLLLFSPAFILLFSLYGSAGAFRKELLVFLAFAIFAVSARSGRIDHRWALPALATYVLAVFSHETAAFCLPFFLYVLLRAPVERGPDGRRSRTAWLYAASFTLVAGVGLVLSMLHPGNAAVAGDICRSLLDRGLTARICDGNIMWLGKDSRGALEEVALYVHGYIAAYPVLLALAVAPFILIDWVRRRPLLLLAAFLPFVPLFMIASDWGRWIYMFVSMTTILLLLLSIRTPMAMKRAPAVVMLVFVLGWSLPHFGVSEPGRGVIDFLPRALAKIGIHI